MNYSKKMNQFNNYANSELYEIVEVTMQKTFDVRKQKQTHKKKKVTLSTSMTC